MAGIDDELLAAWFPAVLLVYWISCMTI